MSEKNLSIHPRVWLNGQKKNTCKPPRDPNKGILGKRMRALYARKAFFKLTQDPKYPNAHREPGSMRG